MLQLGLCSTHLRLPAPVAVRSPTCCLLRAQSVRGSPVRLQPLPQRPLHLANASDSSGPHTSPSVDEESEDEETDIVLQPEEDWVVPGTMADAMKAGTKLGKAVNSACDELTTLGTLESDVLGEAQELLERVGFKGSLFKQQQQAQAAEAPADDATS